MLLLILAASAQPAVTIKSIAANGNRSLALDSDGTVWEWGGKWSTPLRVTGW
ncbi:MAG: hypothetical protein LAQ69_36415 [Acidobacteriia bacterium]|nr:hypothetical protein [Terriglobia bacterium]